MASGAACQFISGSWLDMSSQAPLDHPKKSSSNKLTQQKIAEEERLIRIYEAELAFETSRKRRRSELASYDAAEALFQRGNNLFDVGSDDWLLEQTLEALQSTSSSTAVASSKLAGFLRLETTQWQLEDDNPALQHFLPYMSGIYIEHVQNIVLSNAHCRSYRIQGRVCAANATPFSFRIALTVELSTKNEAKSQRKDTRVHRRGPHTIFTSTTPAQARVVALEADFSRGDPDESNNENHDLFPSEELSSIAKVASETCNLPLLIRQLVSFSQFNRRRIKLLTALHQELAPATAAEGLVLERSSAHELSLTRHETNNSNNKGLICTVVMEWKWNVTWHSRGCDNLCIKDIIVPKAFSRDDEIRILLRPQGLENLLTCTGGSVERAIRIMVQTMTYQDQNGEGNGCEPESSQS